MKRVDNLAKVYIAPLLKKSGFKKRNLSWNRNRGKFIDVISVQKSRSNMPDNERFVIGAGVFVPEYEKIVWNRALKGFANEASCVIRLRLNDFADPSGRAFNSLWSLYVDEDIEKAGVEVQSAIEDGLLPFLDSVDDFTKLHEVLDSMSGWHKDYSLTQIYFALLKNSLDEKETSMAMLKDLIAKDEWTDHAKRALRHVKGVKKSEAI